MDKIVKIGRRRPNKLTRLEQLQVQVAATTAADAAAAGVVAAGTMSPGLLHRPRGATLELLQEAVDLVLDAGGRAGHLSGER